MAGLGIFESGVNLLFFIVGNESETFQGHLMFDINDLFERLNAIYGLFYHRCTNMKA